MKKVFIYLFVLIGLLGLVSAGTKIEYVDSIVNGSMGEEMTISNLIVNYTSDTIDMYYPFYVSCNLIPNSNDRFCYLDVEVNLKTSNMKLLVSQFKNTINASLLKNVAVTVDGIPIASLNNKALTIGNKTVRLSFNYPKDKSEKFNLTMFGITVDPEISSCSNIVTSGYYNLTAQLLSI